MEVTCLYKTPERYVNPQALSALINK